MTYYSDSEGGRFLIKMMLWPLWFAIACAALAKGNLNPMLKVFGILKDEDKKENTEEATEDTKEK